MDRISGAFATLLPTLEDGTLPFAELYPTIQARETTPPRHRQFERVFPV